jgi:hypothetical protein
MVRTETIDLFLTRLTEIKQADLAITDNDTNRWWAGSPVGFLTLYAEPWRLHQ